MNIERNFFAYFWWAFRAGVSLRISPIASLSKMIYTNDIYYIEKKEVSTASKYK